MRKLKHIFESKRKDLSFIFNISDSPMLNGIRVLGYERIPYNTKGKLSLDKREIEVYVLNHLLQYENDDKEILNELFDTLEHETLHYIFFYLRVDRDIQHMLIRILRRVEKLGITFCKFLEGI